jgi:hypothetical protein
MTDIAAILACYRSGQISEAEMVDICREWPEVEAALRETSITEREESAAETPSARQNLPSGKNEETSNAV